jgi:iron complex transport system ATP-binding protein
MLTIRQLCYQNILKSIDFTAKSGEFIGVVGPNGSGKTTLLKCVAGILRDVSGGIELDGQDSATLSSREIARLVSYVPQIVETVIPFTVIEFLRLSRFPYQGMASRQVRVPDFDSVLQQVGVFHLKHRQVASLSGGELQRVLVAAALAQDTPIVLLDEPTSHLDPLRAGEFVETLASLKSEGRHLFLMVSHNAEEMARLCDRIVGLKGGGKKGEFAPSFLSDPASRSLIYGNGEGGRG